ncbi:MAG: hypothetical protein H7841_07710 [Magnetospirillum sp. WYHS-4]
MEQRFANADHLYGMAAECGLKSLMLAFGMPFDDARGLPSDQKDREHADGIWVRYETYRCGHHRGVVYALPPSNPFADWKVSQRYANRNRIGQNRADAHRAGAREVHSLVVKAALEGLI